MVAWWTCWKWSTLTVISHMDISIYVRHGRISYQQIPTKRNIILLKKMRHPKTYVPPHRGYLKMFIVIIATGAFYEDVLSTLMHINVYKRVYTRSAEWCICLGDPKGAGHYKCMWDFHSLHIDSLDRKTLSESCIRFLQAMTLVSEHCQKYEIFQNLLFIFSI